MTAVGFEPTPFRNGALSRRLRPLSQTVLRPETQLWCDWTQMWWLAYYPYEPMGRPKPMLLEDLNPAHTIETPEIEKESLGTDTPNKGTPTVGFC